MKQSKRGASIVRRSVALPRKLMEEVSAIAPSELRQNFNRLVCTALHEFAKAQRARTFEREMQDMAADPQILAECEAIEREFAPAVLDGLRGD